MSADILHRVKELEREVLDLKNKVAHLETSAQRNEDLLGPQTQLSIVKRRPGRPPKVPVSG
jgi:hypothetical protein